MKNSFYQKIMLVEDSELSTSESEISEPNRFSEMSSDEEPLPETKNQGSTERFDNQRCQNSESTMCRTTTPVKQLTKPSDDTLVDLQLVTPLDSSKCEVKCPPNPQQYPYFSEKMWRIKYLSVTYVHTHQRQKEVSKHTFRGLIK